jgi:hypothetical protein
MLTFVLRIFAQPRNLTGLATKGGTATGFANPARKRPNGISTQWKNTAPAATLAAHAHNTPAPCR